MSVAQPGERRFLGRNGATPDGAGGMARCQHFRGQELSLSAYAHDTAPTTFGSRIHGTRPCQGDLSLEKVTATLVGVPALPEACLAFHPSFPVHHGIGLVSLSLVSGRSICYITEKQNPLGCSFKAHFETQRGSTHCI